MLNSIILLLREIPFLAMEIPGLGVEIPGLGAEIPGLVMEIPFLIFCFKIHHKSWLYMGVSYHNDSLLLFNTIALLIGTLIS